MSRADARLRGAEYFQAIGGTVQAILTNLMNGGLFPNQLTVGQETTPRELAIGEGAMLSGTAYLTFFTARKTETVGDIRVIVRVGTVDATLSKMGLYAVASNNEGTLIASTANDPSMFVDEGVQVVRPFTAPVGVIAGQRYAVGLINISPTADPQIVSGIAPQGTTTGFSDESREAPMIQASMPGQADLPTSFENGELDGSIYRFYSVILP